MTGHLIISLDFELHWGSFDKHPLTSSRKKYYLNTRNAINSILTLFSQYQIHATWATVGLLFNESKSELLDSLPNRMPSYKDQKLSAYNYLEANPLGENEDSDPFHFAKALIKKIIETPNQEIGTHSFAHYYCNEDGQTVEEFAEDLDAAINAGRKFNLEIKSMVFPRNQFNSEYLKVCREKGITSVRSNPADWWWQINSTSDESWLKRIYRGADAYLPLGKKTSFPVSTLDSIQMPLLIPASRLLRPYRKSEFILNKRRISRIKNEMSIAAKSNEIYHLWWHPHNFGNNTFKNLEGLKEIISHFNLLKNNFGFQSLNMGQLAEMVLKNELTQAHGER